MSYTSKNWQEGDAANMIINKLIFEGQTFYPMNYLSETKCSCGTLLIKNAKYCYNCGKKQKWRKTYDKQKQMPK